MHNAASFLLRFADKSASVAPEEAEPPTPEETPWTPLQINTAVREQLGLAGYWRPSTGYDPTSDRMEVPPDTEYVVSVKSSVAVVDPSGQDPRRYYAGASFYDCHGDECHVITTFRYPYDDTKETWSRYKV